MKQFSTITIFSLFFIIFITLAAEVQAAVAVNVKQVIEETIALPDATRNYLAGILERTYEIKTYVVRPKDSIYKLLQSELQAEGIATLDQLRAVMVLNPGDPNLIFPKQQLRYIVSKVERLAAVQGPSGATVVAVPPTSPHSEQAAGDPERQSDSATQQSATVVPLQSKLPTTTEQPAVTAKDPLDGEGRFRNPRFFTSASRTALEDQTQAALLEVEKLQRENAELRAELAATQASAQAHSLQLEQELRELRAVAPHAVQTQAMAKSNWLVGAVINAQSRLEEKWIGFRYWITLLPSVALFPLIFLVLLSLLGFDPLRTVRRTKSEPVSKQTQVSDPTEALKIQLIQERNASEKLQQQIAAAQDENRELQNDLQIVASSLVAKDKQLQAALDSAQAQAAESARLRNQLVDLQKASLQLELKVNDHSYIFPMITKNGQGTWDGPCPVDGCRHNFTNCHMAALKRHLLNPSSGHAESDLPQQCRVDYEDSALPKVALG